MLSTLSIFVPRISRHCLADLVPICGASTNPRPLTAGRLSIHCRSFANYPKLLPFSPACPLKHINPALFALSPECLASYPASIRCNENLYMHANRIPCAFHPYPQAFRPSFALEPHNSRPWEESYFPTFLVVLSGRVFVGIVG